MLWHEKLKLARKIKGYTLRDVEAYTDLSNAQLSLIETGKIKNPGFFNIIKLMKLYNLEISDLEPVIK